MLVPACRRGLPRRRLQGREVTIVENIVRKTVVLHRLFRGGKDVRVASIKPRAQLVAVINSFATALLAVANILH